MNLTARALRSGVLNAGRAVASLAATTLVSAVVARSLGPDRMSDFTYALWWAGVFAFFANLDLPALLTKYVAEYVAREQPGMAGQMVRWAVGFQLLVSTLASVLAVLLLHWWWKDGDLRIIVVAAALVLPLSLQQTAAGALAGLQRYDHILRIALAGSALKVLLVLLAAMWQVSTPGMLAVAVGGSLAEAALSVAILSRLLHTEEPSAAAESARAFRRMLWLATISAFSSLTDLVVWERSETFFLKQYAPTRALADYGVAFELSTKVGGLGTVFASVLLPIGVDAYARGGDPELRLAYNRALKYLAMIMLPASLAAIALAQPLVLLVYGEAFRPAIVPLRLLLLSVPIIAVSQAGHMVIYAREQQLKLVQFGFGLALLNIALAWLLVKPWGAAGAAAANALSQTAAVLVGVVFIERLFSTPGLPWKGLLKISAASVFAAVPLYAAVEFRAAPPLVALAGLADLVMYVGLLAALRETSLQEWQALRDLFAGRGPVSESESEIRG